MSDLLFATGNSEKFHLAQVVCAQHGITLIQQATDVDEIQAEDKDPVIRDKAQKVFDIVKQPVVVTDDWWEVPALNGFPGPYMKSIDIWFKPEHWIDIMQNQTDRRIIGTLQLGYQDANGFKVFRHSIQGTIGSEVRGDYGRPLQKVVMLDGDNGLTISEVYDRKLNHEDRDALGGWKEFIEWYKSKN